MIEAACEESSIRRMPHKTVHAATPSPNARNPSWVAGESTAILGDATFVIWTPKIRPTEVDDGPQAQGSRF